MIVNPDLDGYTKIQNNLKIFRETQKNTSFWKSKE